MPRSGKSSELLPGTLDLLILRALRADSLHGYGIAERLRQVSDDVLQVGESSLYPALQRLLLDGYVRAEWGASENNRRARYLHADRRGPKAARRRTGRVRADDRRDQRGAPPRIGFRECYCVSCADSRGCWDFAARTSDLREELAHHRAMIEGALQTDGLASGDAHDAARRAMGNETYMREESRAVWLWPGVEGVLQDIRYAARGLRRSPAFASVAVISLALGIGANTAIFSLIHSLLLARVPVSAPGELVSLQRDYGAKGTDERLSRAEFDALAAARMPLAMFASRSGPMDLDGVTVNVSLDAVDGHYFDLLGIHAQRGRLLSAIDNSSSAQIAVVTDRFWRGRLNADSAVLGRVVKIAGHPFTIVGVMPPRFAGLRFPAFIDVTIPYTTATTLGILREGDRIGRSSASWAAGRRDNRSRVRATNCA